MTSYFAKICGVEIEQDIFIGVFRQHLVLHSPLVKYSARPSITVNFLGFSSVNLYCWIADLEERSKCPFPLEQDIRCNNRLSIIQQGLTLQNGAFHFRHVNYGQCCSNPLPHCNSYFILVTSPTSKDTEPRRSFRSVIFCQILSPYN